LFSIASNAACRCNCKGDNRNLCEPTYDLDHPCGVLCPSLSPNGPPAGKTACPTEQVYNMDLGVYEWRVLCAD
jgi:hypothetical protein